MATWDNWDLGLAGWWEIPGMPHGNLGQLGPGTGRVVGSSWDVPWQIGITGT